MRSNGTAKAVISVVAMLFVGMLAIVLVEWMRPTQDNMTLHVLIVGFVTAITTNLLAFLQIKETTIAVEETKAVAKDTHLNVNSRLDKMLLNAERASHAEGVLEGQGMEMVSRTQGPIEVPKGEPPIPPNIGFKVTSTYMIRKEL